MVKYTLQNNKFYITPLEAIRQWRAATQRMKSIGINRVLLAGRLYWNDRGKPDGCVAEAARRFYNGGLEVICTEACFPGSRITRKKRMLLEKFGIR